MSVTSIMRTKRRSSSSGSSSNDSPHGSTLGLQERRGKTQPVFTGSRSTLRRAWQDSHARSATTMAHTHRASDVSQSMADSLGEDIITASSSCDLVGGRSQSVGGVVALLELMGENELEQAIDAIERQESEASHFIEHHFSSFRIIYMGNAPPVEKRTMLNAFLSSLAARQHDYPPRSLEQRYHVIQGGGGSEKIQCFQDSGLSIILADLTGDGKASMDKYITQQCRLNTPSRSTSLDSALLPSPPSSPSALEGGVFSDKTPNGIDLCVYFYDDCAYENDMKTLQKLAKHGVSLMPVLVHCPPNELAARRTRLADLLAQYKLKGVDLCRLEIETPSFMRRTKRRLSVSDHLNPSPFQILTVDQFAALDPVTVYDILKHVRKKGIEREHTRAYVKTSVEALPTKISPEPYLVDTNDTPDLSDQELDDQEKGQGSIPLLIAIVLGMACIMGLMWIWFVPTGSIDGQWMVSLSVGIPTSQSLALFVSLRHRDGIPNIIPPVPVLLVDNEPIATEQDVHLQGDHILYRAIVTLPTCDHHAQAKQVRVQPTEWMDVIHGSPLFLSSDACFPSHDKSNGFPSKAMPSTLAIRPESSWQQMARRVKDVRRQVRYCFGHGFQLLETILQGESAPIYVPPHET